MYLYQSMLLNSTGLLRVFGIGHCVWSDLFLSASAAFMNHDLLLLIACLGQNQNTQKSLLQVAAANVPRSSQAMIHIYSGSSCHPISNIQIRFEMPKGLKTLSVL